jgi:hypothetical protein
MRRVILLLAGDMRDQRLHAHQRQPPLGAQPLHLQPPRPGRLTRHRHRREPLRPRLPHRPGQRTAQPERLHPHRLTRQHPHIMINHRDRLLILTQVDPDHRSITGQQLPQSLPPRIPPPVTSRRAATLTHRTSSSLRLGHQARTTAPGGRSCISHTPAEQRPLARCPITTAALCAGSRRGLATLRHRWHRVAERRGEVSRAGQMPASAWPMARTGWSATGKGWRALRGGPGGSARSGPR